MKKAITSNDGKFKVLVTDCHTSSLKDVSKAIVIRCDVGTDEEVTHTFHIGHDEGGDFVWVRLNTNDSTPDHVEKAYFDDSKEVVS